MNPQNLLRVLRHDQFHQHFITAARQNRLHWAEAGNIDINRTRLARLLFAHTNSANFRLRKYRRRDQFMIWACWIILECGLHKTHRFMDRHGRKVGTVGYIAHRIDIIDIRARISINGDRTALAQRNTCRVQCVDQ